MVFNTTQKYPLGLFPPFMCRKSLADAIFLNSGKFVWLPFFVVVEGAVSHATLEGREMSCMRSFFLVGAV